MEMLLFVLVVCEMLFVNLTTVHLCLPKKVSTPKIIVTLVLFTAAMIGCLMPFLSRTPSFGNGNGLFVVAGALYLIPLKFLYQAKLSFILEVVCTSWIYTMLAFSLGAQVGKAFAPEHFPLMLFSVQTLFYLVTVYSFWRFIREKFIYVLANIPAKTRKYLRYGCVLWFLAVIFINLSFVASDLFAVKVATLLFFGAVSYVSYSLLYEITTSSNAAMKMKKIADTDYLTGLPNRYRLWEDVREKIEGRCPFHVVYMDLDKFKTINDRFGHLAGDRYLILFAGCIQRMAKDCGKLYRISGDEFLVICENPRFTYEDMEKKLSGVTFEDPVFGLFLGVSVGVSSYPADGKNLDELMAVADERMYENKERKGHRRADASS